MEHPFGQKRRSIDSSNEQCCIRGRSRLWLDPLVVLSLYEQSIGATTGNLFCVCVHVYGLEGWQSDKGGGQRAVEFMCNVGPILFVRLS